MFVPQYGRLAAIYVTGVISLRVSPKCTSHIIGDARLWYIYILGTNNIQHLKQLCNTTPHFLPYLHHRMCVRGGENNDGYRVRLKIGVRSLLHRKVQCQPTKACCCHVFVPQYGRLAAILSLLAFNHCACLRNARRISYRSSVVVYLHPWNKQHSTSQTTL